MKYGFVKVRAASPEIRVGDVAYNAEQIVKEIQSAEQAGVQLLVLPELCLSGATCGDLFLQDTLLKACERALSAILDCTKECNALAFFGLPFTVEGKLYNCAAAIQRGRLLAVVPKSNERASRYFSTPQQTVTLEMDGADVPFGASVVLRDENEESFTVAVTFGEELSSVDNLAAWHAKAGANILVNLSASQELVGGAEATRLQLQAQSKALNCGFVRANAGVGESTANGVYAGRNLIVEAGDILAESEPFTGGYAESEIDVQALAYERRSVPHFTVDSEDYAFVAFTSAEGQGEWTRKIAANPFVPSGETLEKRAELILQIQSHALAKRLERAYAEKAVIGVSGGLDSTLAFLATVRAFDLLKRDRKDILAYTMPGFGTTLKTKNNSLLLMKEMGVTCKTVNITASVKRHFADIEHDENCLDTTYENAQARMRTLILMDVANQQNGLVIGTGDLSELALGWCTYGGDQMSSYSVNCDIPKTLVKAIVAYEGKRLGGKAQKIIQSILDTEISPELLPPDKAGNIAQKTEDLVGPYELHDFFLYYTVRHFFSPEKIYFLARKAFQERYDGATVKKWLKVFYKRFFSQQFKRSCSPDGAQVGRVSLSPKSYQTPSDAVGALWLSQCDEIDE